MNRRSKHSICSSFVVAVLLLSTVGCSATSDRWTGSVDAVFRYRPSESSTLVYRVRPDSMSEVAGLKPGDLLLAVDGQDVTNASYAVVRAALKGPVGTMAKLTVKRGSEIIDIEVERDSKKRDDKD
ncbi:MAG: PDZ domain-containing protein [Deltaproteobacteria bacterium]|nr:PDZ domain-containing protein [Deltaproteobacteria bacterium]